LARRYVDELRVSAGAEDELAAHGVTPDEVLEVSWDDPAFFRDTVGLRELMIGRSMGGRLLTIVVQAAPDFGVWDVVTGWDSGTGEQTAWQRARPRNVR
jgi:hypothetical protein